MDALINYTAAVPVPLLLLCHHAKKVDRHLYNSPVACVNVTDILSCIIEAEGSPARS